jgi:hypothetical protein
MMTHCVCACVETGVSDGSVCASTHGDRYRAPVEGAHNRVQPTWAPMRVGHAPSRAPPGAQGTSGCPGPDPGTRTAARSRSGSTTGTPTAHARGQGRGGERRRKRREEGGGVVSETDGLGEARGADGNSRTPNLTISGDFHPTKRTPTPSPSATHSPKPPKQPALKQHTHWP